MPLLASAEQRAVLAATVWCKAYVSVLLHRHDDLLQVI